MRSAEISGLYAITPDSLDTESLSEMVLKALAGGAKLVQYRNKAADILLRRKQVDRLLCICRGYNVPLIINDHLDLALETGADGVHLGQKDVSILQARRLLGDKKIIGISCYNQIELSVKAEDQGANYVAFGAFFPSVTKPDAVTASLELLSMAKLQLHVPIVTIGGITLKNANVLIRFGSRAIAVSNALFGSKDIQLTAKSFAEFFPQASV